MSEVHAHKPTHTVHAVSIEITSQIIPMIVTYNAGKHILLVIEKVPLNWIFKNDLVPKMYYLRGTFKGGHV